MSASVDPLPPPHASGSGRSPVAGHASRLAEGAFPDHRVPRDPDAAIAALRADAHLFYLDGAGVLFREEAQTLHLLNPTAALVCSLVQEGHDAPAAARALQDLQGLDAATSEQRVAAALAQCETALTLPVPARPNVTIPATTPASHRTPVPYAVIEEHCYCLLGTTFRVAFARAEHARAVHPVLAHLETGTGAVDVTIDIVDAGTRIAVYRDREISETCAHTDELAPVVKSLVWITAVNRHEFLLDIHAGVVGNDAACLLLPGAPGSGKSTLTAALVHAGYRLYSDEVALLADGTFDVFPVPLAICVKLSGLEALAGRFPQLRELPHHVRADGKRVIYLPPSRSWLPPAAVPCPVAALVFPTYAPGADTRLLRLPAFEALGKLLDECLVLRQRLDFGRVERLVTWIGSTPAYRLDHASLDAAVELVCNVVPAPHLAATGHRPETDACD